MRDIRTGLYKIGETRIYVELGEGINPLPLSQFEEIYQESLGIFWLDYICKKSNWSNSGKLSTHLLIIR